MKTVISFVLLVFLLPLYLDAQLAPVSTFAKGDKVLNLGIGFGSSYYSSFYTSHIPAISASFEVGVKEKIMTPIQGHLTRHLAVLLLHGLQAQDIISATNLVAWLRSDMVLPT